MLHRKPKQDLATSCPLNPEATAPLVEFVLGVERRGSDIPCPSGRRRTTLAFSCFSHSAAVPDLTRTPHFCRFIWSFPNFLGMPINHPFWGDFHSKPSIWESPIHGNPHIIKTLLHTKPIQKGENGRTHRWSCFVQTMHERNYPHMSWGVCIPQFGCFHKSRYPKMVG